MSIINAWSLYHTVSYVKSYMVYKNKQVFQDDKNLHTIGNTRLWVGITCINHILYISFCSHESLTITDIDVNRFFKPPSHAGVPHVYYI